MWENLKAGIASVIRTNNNNEITGANLQSVLNNIVNTVGANATFAGMATPNTNPGSPDGPVFYFTQGPGLYVNFGNLQIDDNIVILANLTGVWQNLGPLVYESFTPADKSKLESIESGAEVNVQSDWNQTDDSEDDYIKNKPSVYTKTEIDQMLTGNVKREIVSELPQTGVDGTIYMVPSATAATGDVYDEYMWLSTQGQVAAHFEKIGTTKADLANYYTKSEVDTALGNKQASITITNNTSTPADNDTVIMQASGTTNTTSFLRRTMSNIWAYIKSKADKVYAPWINTVNTPGYLRSQYQLYDWRLHDYFYALDKRINTVTWKTYNSETDEEIADYSSSANKLFDGNYASYDYDPAHPVEGQYDVIRLTSSTTFTTFGGMLFLGFYHKCVPDIDPVVRMKRGDTNVWVTLTPKKYLLNLTSDVDGNCYYLYTGSPDLTVIEIEITIYGRADRNIYLSNVCFFKFRHNTEQYSAVTKHAVDQQLYGNVTAPSFIKRGGTSQQVLLADGTTINMPSAPGTNKDTLLKNLISGLSSGSDTVTDGTEIITSYAGQNGFNQSGVVNKAYKRPATCFWNYIKGKADNVYTQKGDTYTVNMSADANHQGTNEYRVLATLATADCCILNITKTIYGYPAQNTVWFANQNAMSLISLSDFGFVAIGGRSGQSADLCIPVLPTGHPAVEYKIQIVRSTDSESVTFPSSATYKTYSRPIKANVVMHDEISTDAVTFNITGGTGSVSLEDSNDFIGNVADASTAAGITVTNYEQGQCYRFTFTEELEGVTLYSSNSVALCTVNETIQKGDVLTFTSVSNTAGGWMYSKTGASIKSSDGSVGIEWENGVADLSVPVTPPNVVLNRSELNWEDDEAISIGKDSSALCYSGDDNNPYAYTDFGVLQLFKVNGGSNEYYHEVTAGTTYSITVGSYTVPFTPDNNGYAIVCNLTGTRAWLIDSNHMWSLTTASQSRGFSLKDATAVGTSQYCLGVVSSSDCLTASATLTYWHKTTSLRRNIAIGYAAKANGMYAMTINGISSALGAVSIGYGSKAYANYNVAIGYNARTLKSNAVAIGDQASAEGDNSIAINAKVLGNNAIAIGYDAQATANWSSAIGSNCKTNNSSYSVAMGYSAQTNANYATAIGESCQANGGNSIALGAYGQANGDSAVVMGRYAKVGYKTSDASYPQYKAKRFNAVSFTEGGTQKYYRFLKLDDSPNTATITVNGTTIELTPPNGNVNFFIVVNDSSAPLAYRNIGPYMLVDKTDKYITNSDTRDIAVTQISGNYYAMWLCGYVNDLPQTVSSISLLTYVKSTAALFPSESYAIGYETTILYNNCIAMGRGAVCAREGQIILGSYCIPNEKDRLIVSSGTSGNTRKNILTIDDNEVMHVRGIVNEVRTIDTGGTNAIVTQIKQGVIKVTGGGSLELSTTGAVEGLSVKIYASGASVLITNSNINYAVQSGCFHEFIFLDGDWHAQM